MIKINKIISSARKHDINSLYGLIITTITITAFLIAVDYFTAQASLEVSFKDQKTGYYLKKIQEFYEERKLKIPQVFYNDNTLRGVFYKDLSARNKDFINIGDATSDDDIIKAIQRGQNVGKAYLNQRVNFLEKRVDKYLYKKRIYLSKDQRGFYDEKQFKEILNQVKSKLSEIEYYVFLAALVNSRERINRIYIKNNGEVNLRNIKLTIPAPRSKVTEKIEGNILEYEVIGNLLNKVSVENDSLVWWIPFLKCDEFLLIYIRTKENSIDGEEIFYDFEQDRMIKKRQIYLISSIILVALIILKLVFKGKNLPTSEI